VEPGARHTPSGGVEAWISARCRIDSSIRLPPRIG
jgi:hypothetical protein